MSLRANTNLDVVVGVMTCITAARFDVLLDLIEK
jgi:hypothetical protein